MHKMQKMQAISQGTARPVIVPRDALARAATLASPTRSSSGEAELDHF
ncbi:MAG: hypothetical protein IRZ31_04600 [Thermogemmatispora sp.]|nr:hypothetical protein [Thermogemmatispora sp.]MBX5456160.1 hypothetical protein [Thermogemmatispora sp.]